MIFKKSPIMLAETVSDLREKKAEAEAQKKAKEAEVAELRKRLREAEADLI